MTPDPVQRSYVDALGRTRRPSRDAIRELKRAIETRAPQSTPGADAGPLIVSEGESTRVGPADIRLEDGATISIDDRLPGDLPCGYHTIAAARGGQRRLIVAPRTCHLPEDYRAWGWAIQLYAARSRRSWGIGDLADLRALGRWAKADGAGLALINPLAAAAPIVPQQPSPYFPTSRRFRNPLYLAVEEMDGARDTPGLDRLAAAARALNGDRLIDRDAVYRLKLRAFEAIWTRVRGRRDPRFDAFVAENGAALIEYATFCALAERYQSGWHSWPARYRNPNAAAVRRVADEPALGSRVSFHAWLQYQIDSQLARAAGTVPTMQDLPIGFDADGADAWAFQDVLAADVSVGAPPDEFNTNGQNWGLPPFVPAALRAAGYDPFIQTIRACLRHAGGLRIDHVMGLFRLFWIPDGMSARDGAYVLNPADDLLAIVALESRRAGAVIVGEDLGTVDEDFRRRLMDRAVLSYRLVWFEKEPPRAFPRAALAAVSTHDLPTIAGMWTGSDLDAQKRLHMAPNEEGTQEITARLTSMTRASARTPVADVVARTYRELGKAPSRILTATLDDAMVVEERPNMPASDQWPNWSIALPRPIETLRRDPLAARIASSLARRRRR